MPTLLKSDNLIHVRTVTATQASRGFKELLDAVAAGEEVVITRGNRAIAEMRPASRRTGADLARALSGGSGLDDDFGNDVAAATELLDDLGDPWVVD